MFRFLKEPAKSPSTAVPPQLKPAVPLERPVTSQPESISHHGYAVAARLGAERTAVPAGLTVVGQLAYDSPVRIDGKLEGSLFSSASVVISEQGVFSGKGTIRDFELRGECHASLQVLGRLKICKGARFSGSLAIRSENLIVEEGAIVNAECRYLAA